MAQRLKRLHNFECQFPGCGFVLNLPKGGRYIEAHHLKPLGAPHEGPDSPENLEGLPIV